MDIAAGEQLGRYHLVRKLATGGMAEVFLAKVMGPGGFEKSLVIKRILPALARDPEFVQMFLQEARLAAQFAHPAVVQIFDFGEVNGSYFLAMEYVDGPNLRSILRSLPDRRLPLAVGARVIEEACEGLAYVHEFADPTGAPMGLMHCDVSSDNMLIARNGAVKVVDFGVAKGSGQVSNAAPGTVKGKIAYMPPEQIIGEADLRADVYALGVILYELAAGTRPYEQMPDQQLLVAIIKTEPVPLRSRRPEIPVAFSRIVEKAMARRTHERFQNCRELAAALEDFISSTGERVGTRQLAALAKQYEEDPAIKPPVAPSSNSGTPALVTPYARPLSPSRVSPPRGIPAASADPFAAFGAPVSTGSSAQRGEPPAGTMQVTVGSYRGDAQAAAPVAYRSEVPPLTSSAPARKVDPFDAFGARVAPKPSSPSSLTPGPSSASSLRPPPPPTPDALFEEFFADLEEAPPALQGIAIAPSPKPAPPPPPRAAPAPVAAVAAQPPAKPVDPNSPEARAARVLADATAMRLYEAGPALGTPGELEVVRHELERDESVYLAVRFARHAPKLLKAFDNSESLVIERVAGAVDALLLAEAYGPLASMLERLQSSAGVDAQHRKVFEVALSTFATADQARRIATRLREAPPADVEGLGRVLPYFGGANAPVWLNLFESLDLLASREAVLPGLAGLAALNAAPFLERLQPKRPRRLSELVYCLEKGRVSDRQRVIRELMARLDPSRRREVLMGLAHSGTDDAYRLVTQGITDETPETRVLAIQLLGKHFPERVFQALEGVIALSDDRSEAERRAMWVSVGASTQPAAFQAIVKELTQKASLLNRARVDARKLDALEGLAVMKGAAGEEFMRGVAAETSQSDTVRAAAQRHIRAAALIAETTTHAGESRRWDRSPSTWRDVLLDLNSLAMSSRVLDLSTPTFDIAFARLLSRLGVLVPSGAQASVTTNGVLAVNGQGASDGTADPAISAVLAAFQARSIGSFTFVRTPTRIELEALVRWLAAGSAAEPSETPSITRALSAPSLGKPAPASVHLPAMTDFSREAMIRYVDLVNTYRAWLVERKALPTTPMPEARQAFHELVAAVASRSVRFIGLTPRGRKRDAELFHGANAMMLALMFGAELGLPSVRLLELATYGFFADVGNLELKDETFDRAGRLTEEDQADVTAAKKWSARFPFVRLGDKAGAVAWASVVAEQELDWGTRERPGLLGANAPVGLMGSIVALSRAYETLTTTTAAREGMTRDAALEVITARVAHRFRPELVSLFARFLQRQSARPLG